MTPEERQLITGLFDRLRSFGRPDKDKEAEALIIQSVRAMPDASYMLVQSTLIQEQALEATHSRLQEVEGRLRDLEEERQKSAPSSGSFLGGLFGARPAAAPPSQPPAASSDRPSPWSGSAQQQPAPPPASGGFLQSAMTTAAGVAGGMLAAGAIRDLLGAGAHANPAHAAEARRDHEALARQDAEDDARSDARDQDAQDDADADAEDAARSDTGGSGDDDIEV